ncbi:MAG: Gfo/Idh/MocA family oxidoreductase [Cryobacterium sp.]|nr:Gfo/Idh/MocA family oxidoreductase [Cryobacterium sp.]
MTQEKLKAAIVGCGVIGRVHADAIHEHDGFTVSALIDVDRALAEELADHIENAHGEKRPIIAGSIADAAAAADVDLVVVATPSGLHVRLGLEALAAGKHLIVEKPLDVDVTRGRSLHLAAQEASKRGVVSTVISQHRFDPEAVTIANALAAQRFGRVTSAVASIAWWRSQEYYDSGDWRGTWALDGGGALMNQGVHTVDLLLWFLGKPVEITAYADLLAHERIEVEDTVVAIIRFESGALATLHATTAAYPGIANRIQVHGDHGSGIIDVGDLSYFHAASPDGRVDSFMGLPFGKGNDAETELPLDRRAPQDGVGLVPGHLRQYDDVWAAVRTGARPRVTVEDALDALVTVRAVYLSATLGKPVRFADVLAGDYDDVTTPIGGGER